MKKIILIISIILTSALSTGCDKGNVKNLAENIKKIELTGNLVVHEAYYHNVIEYEKEKGNFLEKDRKLFAEYNGTIKLGINLSQVKIEVKGNEINVTLPKAKVIGEPNVDKESFKAENFIESKDGIFKNKITVDDSNKAFVEAQQNMKESAEKDEDLLAIVQKRAKAVLEESINEFSGLSESQYTINWEYEQ